MVRDHGLDSELCVTVWVCRAKWAFLWNRDHVGEAGGIAVDGGRGGEDDVGDIVLLHGAEEAERAIDVDAVVFERDLARLADSLKRECQLGLPFPTNECYPTFSAAKWMTLSISGCLSKTASSSFSLVMSHW